MKKIAVIHFQPLEKYPPVMNVINSIAAMNNVYCTVYTTNNSTTNWYNSNNVKIKRIATQQNSAILRYWCYIKFNIQCFISLLFLRPQLVIPFETYSILPCYLIKKVYTNTKVIIHYHEYTSLPEINKASGYSKFLHKIEAKLFLLCNNISHTNKQRVDLFLKDNPLVDKLKMMINPNYPPASWLNYEIQNKIDKDDNAVVKLVHVGAVSLTTMYIQNIVEWVVAQNGKYTLDFYTDNITSSAADYLKKINHRAIKLLPAINYYKLPQILVNYDVGLTLYNGHIPNYIYNVPNKVLEYLACSLQVWYSSELISTQTFVHENNIANCYKINFKNIEINSVKNNIAVYNKNYISLVNKESEMINKIKSIFNGIVW